MDIIEKIERSKSTERIDFSRIGCLNLDDNLVKVEASENLIVEPVWTLEDDFDGKIYQDYIATHPKYEGVYVRTEVLKRLEKAAESLDGRYKLVVRAGHRPIEVQLRLLELCAQDYKTDNPSVSDEEALEHARTFVDDPKLSLPSHCGGGSVDVELYDVQRDQLVDFGSPRDLDDEISFLHSDKINRQQKDNRMILLSAMLEAGFASVYSEWWHFSYGDRVWAWFYGEKESLYGFADICEEVVELGWKDYTESDEYETKELFDKDIKSSDGLDIITSSPTVTLYTTYLYPKSRFLVALGDLEEAVKSLPVDPTRTTFIKIKLPELEHSLIEKVFDSYDITYRALHKKPIDSIDLEPIDNDEVVNLYIENHAHHIGIDKLLMKGRIDTYALQRLSGEGFTIYLEDQGDSYETSFFSTDGTTAGKDALLRQLKELGSFEMELDSTLKEFEFLRSNLDEYCIYSCSLYRLKQ